MNTTAQDNSQSLKDLALGSMPIEDSSFATDPMPYLEAARRQHPWLAKCSVPAVGLRIWISSDEGPDVDGRQSANVE